jgi:undecaprenyl pyrophosphate phosphatase UppP
MDMFPSIGFSLLYGLLAFLPLEATVLLKPYCLFLEKDFLNPGLISALSLACSLSIFIYFRHDWASLISGLLRVLLFRKRPETLDETMPFLVLLGFGFYLTGQLVIQKFSPFDFSTGAFWSVGALGTFLIGILLSLSGYWSRRNRRAVDWTFIDALIVGLLQLFSWIPGFGAQAATLIAGNFRNFRFDALVRFSFFLLLPVYLTKTIVGFKSLELSSSEPIATMSWLTFIICFLVCLVSSAVSLDVLKKSSERPALNLTQYFMGTFAIRTTIAVGLLVMFWFNFLG